MKINQHNAGHMTKMAALHIIIARSFKLDQLIEDAEWITW